MLVLPLHHFSPFPRFLLPHSTSFCLLPVGVHQWGGALGCVHRDGAHRARSGSEGHILLRGAQGGGGPVVRGTGEEARMEQPTDVPGETERCHRGVTEGSPRCHRGVIEGSQRCHRGVTKVSQRCHRSISGQRDEGAGKMRRREEERRENQ